ncbi:MAG: hypothetical protein ACYCYG_14635 [Bellilinea sp.]
MKALYLANENRQNLLYLHGSGTMPPVRSIQRQSQPNRLADGLVEEVVTVECRDGSIWNFITELEQRLSLVKDSTAPQYLWFETSMRLIPVYARILEGRIEVLGGGVADRSRGYQGLRLHLLRTAWLEEEDAPIELNNANGANNILGITLYNHKDADSGHVNYCDVKAEDIRGSQPLPARMVLEVGAASVRRLGKIVVSGGINLWDTESSFDPVLEGEAAAAGAGCSASIQVPDVSASAGSYQTFQWTVVDEAAVCRWTLTAERLAWLSGHGLHPVARFHSPPPANTRWRWKVIQPDGSAILDQSAQILLDSSSRLQVLPVFFQPVQVRLAPYQPFTLEAWLECTTAGVKQIDLDFIHLLPLDNYCFFEPVGGIQQDHNLVMDWNRNELYAEDAVSGEKTVSHVASGAPLMLRPGCNHRIYVLYESDHGFLISDSIKLRLQAGARWLEP